MFRTGRIHTGRRGPGRKIANGLSRVSEFRRKLVMFFEADRVTAFCLMGRQRKVRASYSGVAGNARPSQDEDKSHRDESGPACGIWVKRGNLYAKQDQIGKEPGKFGT